MSLIKFPTQIKPSRITVQLMRVDETVASPLTNIQQVVWRGNPAWRWTYEFSNLSMSERDIVQAFLLNCRGAVNKFRVSDPAAYSLRGTVSDWTDIFSGYGSFADETAITSWFAVNTVAARAYVSEARELTLEPVITNADGIDWKGHGGNGTVNSLQAGKAYVARMKFFQNPNAITVKPRIRVGSGGGSDALGYTAIIDSSDVITYPFVIGDTSSCDIEPYYQCASYSAGEQWSLADLQLSRCALVSNSENLLLHSNEFEFDWSTSNANVDSGFWTTPFHHYGEANDGWKLYCTNALSTHYMLQSITKQNCQDMYTFAGFVQPDELDFVWLHLGDIAGNRADCWFDITNGTAHGPNLVGIGFSRPYASIESHYNNSFRIRLTARVSSLSTLRAIVYISANSNWSHSGTGSDGINIAGFQLRQHPFPGTYTPTVTDAIVGSADYQTGSNIVVEGLDRGDVIPAGTRIEIVNRFGIVSSDYYERSEFKRVTKDSITNAQGVNVISIDPPIRNAPIPQRGQSINFVTMHNPVIFSQPEMTARMLNGTIQYIEKPLQMTDIVFDVIEDLTE